MLLNIIKIGVSAVGGFIAYWLGGIDTLLTCLIIMLALDYLTGVLGAIHNNTLNSEIGFKGIIKKVVTLLVVAVAFVIETSTGQAFPIREICIVFFIANEGISLLENAGKIGIKLPKKLINILEQLKDEKGE